MVVNQEGVIISDAQPSKDEKEVVGESEVAAPEVEQAIEGGDPVPMSKEHEEFLRYNKKIRKTVTLPKVGEPDFCQRMKTFIETRGDGMASSDQLIEAYNCFQENCIENKKEEPKPENEF